MPYLIPKVYVTDIGNMVKMPFYNRRLNMMVKTYEYPFVFENQAVIVTKILSPIIA